jgi:hypothetical protein
MQIESIIKKASKSKYVKLSDSELKNLLSVSELLQEIDTCISDKIRLLKFGDEFIIQERSTEQEIIIRPVSTEKEAEDFIKQRLEIYDRMWDGCGCKVNYYD